ncbi:MAG: sulfate respiration complex iron-sulfur protein HmcB [bacterium]
MGVSRRTFLLWMGAAGAGAGFAAAKSSAHGQLEKRPDSLSILFDATLCIGCRACEEACNRVNGLPPPARPFTDRAVLEVRRRPDAQALTVVNQYPVNVPDRQGEVRARSVFRKIQCHHCCEPACASACFVRAITRTPEGAVIYDPSVCVGCRYCMIACPFGIPAYEYHEVLEPRIVKCNLCYPLIRKGLRPACVDTCPMEAMTFARRAQAIRIARERIRRHPDRYVDHVFGEHELGGTNLLYLSGVPFRDIGLPEDLSTRPARELTAGALGSVPIIACLLPILMSGIYVMCGRKDKVARAEGEGAAAAAKAEQDEAQKLADTGPDRTALQQPAGQKQDGEGA